MPDNFGYAYPKTLFHYLVRSASKIFLNFLGEASECLALLGIKWLISYQFLPARKTLEEGCHPCLSPKLLERDEWVLFFFVRGAFSSNACNNPVHHKLNTICCQFFSKKTCNNRSAFGYSSENALLRVIELVQLAQ